MPPALTSIGERSYKLAGYQSRRSRRASCRACLTGPPSECPSHRAPEPVVMVRALTRPLPAITERQHSQSRDRSHARVHEPRSAMSQMPLLF